MQWLYQAVGVAVTGAGMLFLLLALVAAYREVFPPEAHMEQLRRSSDSRGYAELLATVNTLKNWLAMAIVGTVLVFVGGSVASSGPGTLGAMIGLTGPAAVQR